MRVKQEKFLKNKNGFSLVEIQVSFLIASILVLTIGAISSVSTQSYRRLQKEAALYHDISYGFKLLQNRVRTAQAVPTIEEPLVDSEWIDNKRLIVDDGAFGLYQEDGSDTIEFVYLEDSKDTTNRDVILSVSNSEVLNVTFTIDGKSVIIELVGSKDGIEFDLSTDVVRRMI